MRLVVLLVVIAAVTSLTGCSQGNSGTTTATPGSPWNSGTAAARSNGSEISGTYECWWGSITFDGEGTCRLINPDREYTFLYEIDGDTLRLFDPDSNPKLYPRDEADAIRENADTATLSSDRKSLDYYGYTFVKEK